MGEGLWHDGFFCLTGHLSSNTSPYDLRTNVHVNPLNRIPYHDA